MIFGLENNPKNVSILVITFIYVDFIYNSYLEFMLFQE